MPVTTPSNANRAHHFDARAEAATAATLLIASDRPWRPIASSQSISGRTIRIRPAM